MANIVVPEGSTVYKGVNGLIEPISKGANDLATIPTGSHLYLPFTTTYIGSIGIPISALASSMLSDDPQTSVATAIEAFTFNVNANATIAIQIATFYNTLPSATSTTTAIAYIPYPVSSLPGAIVGSTLFQKLSGSYSTTSSSGSAAITTPGVPNSPSSSKIPSGTNEKPTSGSVSDGTFTGAVAGGVVGGFVAGLVVCFLIGFLCFRRKSSKSAGFPTKEPKREESQLSETRESPSLGIATAASMVGWRKHLPQEKDDRTIANSLESVFGQVRTHVEGFYGAQPKVVPNSALMSLEKLQSDGISQILRQSPREPVPLIEAIIVRWIIHRISLRSEIEDSLLPTQYTEIPKQTGWHMESDSTGQISLIESKRGFLQALSQWRMLTGFLRPNPRAEQEFHAHIATKNELASRTILDAFRPYELPNKNSTHRAASLRDILRQACDAGILLFSQPSTFLFDWSDGDLSRTVVVTPAFVRRMDASGELVQPPQVLIPARRVKVQK